MCLVLHSARELRPFRDTQQIYLEQNPDVSFYSAECSFYSGWTSTHLLHKRRLLVSVRD